LFVMSLSLSGYKSPSAPARIRFLIAFQSRAGGWALSSAATPVTCGAAIDVPVNTSYAFPAIVLRMFVPGAAMCIVRRP
jgi:hypothetical protein